MAGKKGRIFKGERKVIKKIAQYEKKNIDMVNEKNI